MIKFVSHSLKETQEFAKTTALKLRPGQTILLFGPMGSGKTTFSKALIKNLGFSGVVTSPTFALVNVYEGNVVVQHFDMYRLENISEAFEVGLDEMLQDKNVINIVEWPEKAKAILPTNTLDIHINIVNDNTREFVVKRGKKNEQS